MRRQLKQQVPRQAVTDAQADRTAQALGRVIGSLCVATLCRDNRCSGILTSWVGQASFSPPGIMLSLPATDPVFGDLPKGTSFVLNILKEGRSVRRHFSSQRSSQDAFTQVAAQLGDDGHPILADALAYLECTVQNHIPTGDHQLIYAKVEAGQLLAEAGVTAIHHRKSGSQY